MNSAEGTSFRNRHEENVSSSESEDEDSSSSSASSSDSSSSGLSSSASSSNNSEDEAETSTAALTLPTSQTTQSTQRTTEAVTTTQASKTNNTGKTGSVSKISIEQATKASSETKNTSSAGEVSSLGAKPASKKPEVAKAKSPEPGKEDDKKAEKSSKSSKDDSVVLKANSSKNIETEIVKSSYKYSVESATGVKKTELVSEQIKKSGKVDKAAADKELEEEQKDKATDKTTKPKPKKTAEKSSAIEDIEDGKQVETQEKITKCKIPMFTEKPSVDVKKEEKQREASEKITTSKTKKSADKPPVGDDIKKEESQRETQEKASKPKAKKSVDQVSVDDEAKEKRENETLEKTKKSTSSKQNQSVEKNAGDEGDEEDRQKEVSEKILKSSKSKKSSENTQTVNTENQKETAEEDSTSSKVKKKLSTDKILDAELEKSASERTSKIPKFKKQVENSSAEDEDKAKKSEETSEKSEKSTYNKNKKSQEKVSDDKDTEIEKPKVTSEKPSKPKKPKSSSDELVVDEKKEEKLLTKLNESEAQQLTSELTPKDPIKKRKKSPARPTEEVSEKEGGAPEQVSNVLVDQTSSNISAKVLEDESTKLSIDETAKDTLVKPKKTLKRSSKSPTPAKDEIVDKSENKESKITTAANESDLLGKAKDVESRTVTDTLDKKEIVTLEDSGPATDKINSGLKIENESDAKLSETNKLEIQVRSKDAKETETIKITGDAEIPDVVVLIADRPSATVNQKKEDGDIEPKAEESQPRIEAQDVDGALGSQVKASEASQDEKSDEGIVAGPSVSEDTLTARVESTTAAAVEDDAELEFGLKRESVDDFIQRILSEVRESDKRMKELVKGEAEPSTERTNNEGGQPERSELKGVAAETKQVGGDLSTSTIRSMALEDATIGGGGGGRARGGVVVVGGGGGGRGNEENRQRNRFADEDDEELAAVGLTSSSSNNSKYLAAARKMRLQTDYDDLDDDDLEKRAREAAAEITRRRRLDQDMEMEAGDYPPFTRTMYGPRVSRRNLQRRHNLGDSEFEGGEESFLSKFRRERGEGGGGYLPEDEFAPRRREETGEIVRQKARGVRSLVEQQTEVIDTVRKASKGLDELDKEIQGVKQLSLGHRAHVEALESAFDSEVRTYENEYQAATEGQRQRKAQPPTQEKKEDVVSLMFGQRPSVDSSQDVFSVLANTSTPAVASFLNIYGSGAASKGPEVQVNGVLDQRPSRDFGFSADLRSGSKADESVYFASERRNEAGSRRETGRLSDASSILSGWSPTVSGISVDTSASDEFLGRVRSKYPSTSFSLSAGESPALSSSYADASSGHLGASSDTQWISRFTRAAVEPSSRSAISGYPSPSYFPSDTSASWRERGTSARRSATLSERGAEGGGGGGGEARWRRSGPDVYFGRSISSSTGTRTRRS